MDKETITKMQEELSDSPKQTNEYSIYDYLKQTPSILIAGSSAIVATVTFLARLITNINIRKTLIFWNIDISNINMDNSALVFQSLMSIFYILLTVVTAIYFDSIYKSYIPIKKYKFANKCLKKTFKKSKKLKKYEKYKEYIKSYKKLRILLNLICFLKMTGVFILSSIGTSLYIFTSSTENKYLIVAILICSIIPFLLLLVLLKIENPINKKEIKSDCEKGNYIKYTTFECFYSTNKKKPIREYFTNDNLSLFAFQTITSCFLLCILLIFIPIKKINPSSNVQIASLNNQEYIVVYQDDEKFYMKEIEVVSNKDNGNETLVIHKDKQKLLTSDNIDIEIRKYDDIKILDIGEEYK